MRKRIIGIICLGASLIMAAGCANTAMLLQNGDVGTEGKIQSSADPEPDNSRTGIEKEEGSNSSSNAEMVKAESNDGLIEANQRFAWEIFRQLNDEDPDKNIFISPMSISCALTMALNGAEGSTADDMKRALKNQGISGDELNSGYKYLMERLANLDEKVKLNIANSIWIRDGFYVNPEFLDLNREAFFARISTLDFNQRSAADTINDWISDATNGLIPKMINPPINSEIMMYLINAIYFKGIWTTQFDPAQSFDDKFQSITGNSDEVRMMNRKGEVDYIEAESYKAVRLPYGNGKVSMYCILPGQDKDINSLIDTFDQQKWEEIRSGLKSVRGVTVQIPKFKMEYGAKDLRQALGLMGMEEAFSETADFSGIADGIFISSVLHKAVIEVNEEGSEAAAVTVVETGITSVIAEKPKTFIANRPFIFVIADDEGNILFVGKMIEQQHES